MDCPCPRPGRRSETAWQPREAPEPPECSGVGQRQSAVGSSAHASRCSAVRCSSRAVQRVQARACPAMLSVVCCPVSGEPVRRRSMQACRRGAAHSSSSRARQAGGKRCRQSAYGRRVKRGGRVRGAKFRGAGGRSSVVRPGLVVRLSCADRQRKRVE